MSIHRVRCACNHAISESTFKCVSSIVVVCGWLCIQIRKLQGLVCKQRVHNWGRLCWAFNYVCCWILCSLLERLLPSSLCKFAYCIPALNMPWKVVAIFAARANLPCCCWIKFAFVLLHINYACRAPLGLLAIYYACFGFYYAYYALANLPSA